MSGDRTLQEGEVNIFARKNSWFCRRQNITVSPANLTEVLQSLVFGMNSKGDKTHHCESLTGVLLTLVLCSLIVNSILFYNECWVFSESLCARTCFCMQIKDDENSPKHKHDCFSCLSLHLPCLS